MRRRTTLFMALILAMLLTINILSSDIQAQTEERAEKGKEYLTALSDAFVEAADKVKPAVVSIVSVKKMKAGGRQGMFPPDFFDQFKDFWGDEFMERFFQHRMPEEQQREYLQRGVGSGFIVDAQNGYILTANHVVQDADEIDVMLPDKRQFKATIKGTDPKTDVAILQIKADNLPEVELGNSDAMRVGDWVVAIGNPFELYYTVTAGIVSAKGRAIGITARHSGAMGYEDFIQTDAAINPGNSGGPLINLEGKVIGINDAIASRSGGYQGIGFAIPINLAESIMSQLIEHGKVVRGWLGVIIQDITPDLAEQFQVKEARGALVSQVFENSPAEKAGLQAGDIIIELNGKPVENVDDLRNRIAMVAPDSKVEIKTIRDSKSMTVSIEIGEQPEDMAQVSQKSQEPESEKTFGITVANITDEIRQRLNIPEDEKGVIIVDVDQGSMAAMAGLQKGSIITEVNRKKISSMEDYKDAVKKSEKDGSVLLLIKDERGSRFVLLKSK